MNRLFVIIICLFFMTAANADVFEHPCSAGEIINELPQLESISCKFKQEKYFPASKVTLNSSGNFTFEKGKGVTFYTTYPIKSTASYTSKEYRQINTIINAISNKSYSRLEKDFRFYYEKSGNLWKLGLLPKSNSQCADYIKSIEIEGIKDISKMVIITKDLTRTTIQWEK